MNQTAGRRDFLKYAATVTVGTGLLATSTRVQGQGQEAKLLKACQYNMLPKDLKDAEKFALAKKCGFEGVELNGPIADLAAAKEMGALARQAGVPIHGVVNGWGGPLSDPKPENVAKGMASMETSLRCAKAVGADAVLLVPAVVNEEVGYGEAWERSQKNIRKLLPLAKELQVTIAVENVWNKFLLSPLEFAKYVDQFDDPWLKAYVDVGNMIQFGFAQDWVRTVGKRIVKIHLKDFKRKDNRFTANLLEGDVNWPQVRKALEEISYKGYMTTELDPGDEAYLTDLSRRIDKIIAMKTT
ncbi:MAG: sugar phosphate isomerase/epimerase [Phycisphaerae bacterium]|nr:sugar phosphate isomerase/epimerase [Phycisphaerae bacterium]